jgi:dTDP-4-dehydrorhamnose 3,5-epimerase
MERGMTDIGIAGVTLTPLREIVDARGAVLHMLRADAADFTAFGECYFSLVNPGCVKAWKRHHRQSQNLAVPMGRMRFVVCDTREHSATHGAMRIVDLGRPGHYARLHLPPLVWYGFACVGDASALVANCADLPHDPAESEAVAIEQVPLPGAIELLRAGSAPG